MHALVQAAHASGGLRSRALCTCWNGMPVALGRDCACRLAVAVSGQLSHVKERRHGNQCGNRIG
jgi:hypothetical protein